MSPRRGDRAAPPPVDGEYDVRFATNQAALGWEQLDQQPSRRSPHRRSPA